MGDILLIWVCGEAEYFCKGDWTDFWVICPSGRSAVTRWLSVARANTVLDFAGDRFLSFLFVLAVGLVAGTISGIVGTGSSIMLMPVLVYQYGPKQAVPIMAVAAVMANLSRILAWWREVDWRACAAYSITGIPGRGPWRPHPAGAALARRRHFDRRVSDRDGAGAALARPA